MKRLRQDAFRPGRKQPLGSTHTKAAVQQTLGPRPATATHWSTRTMAPATGWSAAAVRRIWKAQELKPPVLRTCKRSNDPRCVEKLEAVVGLYPKPPAHALVLSGDEQSQSQALARTQSG